MLLLVPRTGLLLVTAMESSTLWTFAVESFLARGDLPNSLRHRWVWLSLRLRHVTTYNFNLQQTWNETLHQLKATPRGNLVTSAGNGLLALWKPAYGKLLHSLRGQSGATQCLDVVGEQLVSVSNNGHVVVYDFFENSVR